MDAADKLHESVRIRENMDDSPAMEGAERGIDSEKPPQKKSRWLFFFRFVCWYVLILTVSFFLNIWPVTIILVAPILIASLLFELLTTGKIVMGGKGAIFTLY